jgi:hypothetical protein
MTKRKRQRRQSTLTGSELDWLGLEVPPGVHINKFDQLELESPHPCPGAFDRLDGILDRAAGIAPEERIAELRADVARRRRAFERNHPTYVCPFGERPCPHRK